MSLRTHLEATTRTIPPDGGLDRWHSIIKAEGYGELLAIFLHMEYRGLQFRIYLDGELQPFAWNEFWRIQDLREICPDSKEGICLAQYDDVNDWYSLLITLAWKWKKTMEITVKNPAAGNSDVTATVWYDRLAELPRPTPDTSVQEPGVLIDPEM